MVLIKSRFSAMKPGFKYVPRESPMQNSRGTIRKHFTGLRLIFSFQVCYFFVCFVFHFLWEALKKNNNLTTLMHWQVNSQLTASTVRIFVAFFKFTVFLAIVQIQWCKMQVHVFHFYFLKYLNVKAVWFLI